MTPQRPDTIEKLLSAAFGKAAVPQNISRFFQWEPLRPGSPGASREAAHAVAREINALADEANRRLREARERLDALESSRRSARAASEVAEARRALQTRLATITAGSAPAEAEPPPPHEADVEAARRSVAEAEAGSENWRTLAGLADVVAGLTQPNRRLAERLGREVWEICPPAERAARAAARSSADARARPAAARRDDDEGRTFETRVAAIEERLRSRRRGDAIH